MKQEKPLSLTVLLSNWFSISMLFISGEVVLRYGAKAGFVMVLAFLVALILVFPLLKEKRLSNVSTDWLRLFWLMEVILLQLFIGIILIKEIFSFAIFEAAFWTIMGSLFFTLLLKYVKKLLTLFEISLLSLIFGMAILLPNYVYLQKGLETVYHNLLHYHPKLLHQDQTGINGLFFLLVLIFFSKLFVQIPVLRQVTGSTNGKGFRKLIIAGIIWSTIVLAFSTMTIVSITQNMTIVHSNELVPELLRKLSTPFIFYTVLISFYIGTFIKIALSFLTFLDFPHKGSLSPKLIYLTLGCLIVLVPYLYVKEYTVLAIFLYVGALLSSLTILSFLFSLVKNLTMKNQ
ncbi:hypothetical protein JCM9140_2832 [Halalkalibacter wakoensis JCM 9140]|uniref:Spore germination protein n=1 Tax=Halalkalibacter wakoensis JCM 9140 TaxID=1236970 RepID=W4Q3T1_9BACI|nr:hypothetical protein [Halalkalibacter wakoensis]GAE26741.1 hypothetical protein JCM9140_2832 [Halalkalibacter wakoensis JCM 9140]